MSEVDRLDSGGVPSDFPLSPAVTPGLTPNELQLRLFFPTMSRRPFEIQSENCEVLRSYLRARMGSSLSLSSLRGPFS